MSGYSGDWLQDELLEEEALEAEMGGGSGGGGAGGAANKAMMKKLHAMDTKIDRLAKLVEALATDRPTK